MRNVRAYGGPALIKLLFFAIFGVFIMILKYVLKSPQPLKSVFVGEEHLYKWTQGHVFYKITGTQDLPALVLFHAPEMGGSSYEMRNVIDELSKHYCLYTMDLLGFGLSDHPSVEYTAETYISLYQDFLRDIVERPALLLASGLSANYCIEVAHRTPNLSTGLILLSPASLAQARKATNWQNQLLGQSKIGTFLYACMSSRGFLRRVIARQHMLTSSQVTKNELNHVSAVVHQLGAHHAAQAYLAGNLALDVTLTLQQIRQPVLIIVGGDAPVSIDVQHLSVHIQTTLISAASIRVHEERPTAVIQSILTWQKATEPVAELLSSTPTTISDVYPLAEPTAGIEVEQIVSAVSAITERMQMEDRKKSGIKEGDVAEEIFVFPEDSIGTEKSLVVETTPVEVEVAVADRSEAASVDRSEVALVDLPVDINIEAYCVKCRTKRGMQNAKRIVTKNGRNAMEGICPVCGTRLFRFVAS